MRLQLSGRPSPEHPVQTPSLQKAQMFAWTHWGLRIKPVVPWQWVAEDRQHSLLTGQGAHPPRSASPHQNQSLLTSINESGLNNNTQCSYKHMLVICSLGKCYITLTVCVSECRWCFSFFLRSHYTKRRFPTMDNEFFLLVCVSE